MINCTISLLSWKRTENINRIIQQYNFYKCVSDIIVWNNNPAFLLSDLELPKVKVINCTRDLGLDTRFTGALLAESRCVITHDDDLILSEENIANLIKHWEQDCTRIYTYEGRIIKNGKYSCAPGPQRIENVSEPTEVDITLTRTACFDKLLAAEYMKWSDAIFYDVENNLNGEDIALSYISRKVNGKTPLVIPIPDIKGYLELPANDKISTRQGFIERRCKIAQRCDLLFPAVGEHGASNVAETPTAKEIEGRDIVIFGPGNYPTGTNYTSWTMNTTLSKFAIDDNQDGKMLWIELEKGLEYMIGVIPIYTSWLPAKLKETDTLYIKHMEIDPSINVDVKITFLNPNTNKEIHSKTILLKNDEANTRILEANIPLINFLGNPEHENLLEMGCARSIVFVCHCNSLPFTFKIQELKIIKEKV